VGAYDIVPSGFTSTNYAITFAKGTLTITKATITIVINNAARQFGAPNPTFTGTISGVVAGDGIGANYGTAATQWSPVGQYPITAAVVDPLNKQSNYTINASNGTLTIGAWAAQGFYSPVATGSSIVVAPNTVSGVAGAAPVVSSATVWNTSKGGSTIPLKFDVFQNGLGTAESTNPADVLSIVTALTSCPSGSVDDAIDYVESTGIGGAVFYDGEQMHLNWKTPSVSKDTCYRVTATLKDNTTIHTFVKLKK
jgi:hypothetical protein